jgi:prepilin-type N-terminal cleavage/methylation domain-containing protein
MSRRILTTGAARHRRGFTLIEASLATVIIGVGFVAVLQLIATGTVVNAESSSMTTGMNLARGINEYLLQKKYADLPGYNGAHYTPPKDSRGSNIDILQDWTQNIEVVSVDPTDLTRVVADPTPQAVRVTVTVVHNGNQVCQLSWYVLEATP